MEVILKKYTVIDAHCDTASEILDSNEELLSNSRHLSLEKLNNYNSYIQFFAAWIDKNSKNPFLRAVEILDKIKQEVRKNSEIIEEITSLQDVKNTILKGKHGAVYSIEDARALCGSVASVRAFYDLGVRAITLAWNDDNEVTDGIASVRCAGLTAFGKEVVREMNRLNMIVDVSHITEKGFWDVLDVSESPVMASHSNAKKICSHRRNLSDEQLTAMINNKGIVCINIYPEFLSDNKRANVDTVISHIDHILSLGGENHIGLGSDFDGVDCLIEDFHGADDYYKLFDKMSKIGYSDELINKITHENFLNFIERIEK